MERKKGEALNLFFSSVPRRPSPGKRRRPPAIVRTLLWMSCDFRYAVCRQSHTQSSTVAPALIAIANAYTQQLQACRCLCLSQLSSEERVTWKATSNFGCIFLILILNEKAPSLLILRECPCVLIRWAGAKLRR